jgi:hypothetical protein
MTLVFLSRVIQYIFFLYVILKDFLTRFKAPLKYGVVMRHSIQLFLLVLLNIVS